VTQHGSVKALREAGISAQTVASSLASPLPSPIGPEICFVDESRLVATSKANELLKAASELGVERIVFVGDQRQNHAIEAGVPLRQFLADNMAVANLNVIHRQRDRELRRVVEAAPEWPCQAFELLQQQARISEIAGAKQRYQRIAADYLQAHEARQTALVVNPGNDERRALNAEIRTLLVASGHVEDQGCEHSILVRRDLTPAQIVRVGSYQEDGMIHCAGTRPHSARASARTAISRLKRSTDPESCWSCTLPTAAVSRSVRRNGRTLRKSRPKFLSQKAESV
jgi:hypothetical protein